MTTGRQGRAGLLAIAMLLAGCSGSGEGLDENGRPPDEGGNGEPGGGEEETGGVMPTIESIQEHIFTPRCASCHSGASAPMGLRLEDAQTSHDNLVGVRSVQDPTLFRVEAGNADDSYLVHKVEGTQSVGNQMPNGGPPLDEEQIAAIRQWISDGAAPPQQAGKAQEPAMLQSTTPVAGAQLVSPPAVLLAAVSRELDANRLDGNSIILLRSGGDGRFGQADDRRVGDLEIALARGNARVILIGVPPTAWTPDRYRLLLRGDGPAPLADLDGRALDGDGDGRPGGDFVLEFVLGAVR